MFKIYTKHTTSVGETVFEHFKFAIDVAKDMFISSVLLVVHGCTGGLFVMPEKYNICSMAERMCEAKEDRLSKQKEVEDDK